MGVGDDGEANTVRNHVGDLDFKANGNEVGGWLETIALSYKMTNGEQL
jgi:hypothetical protein